MYIILYLGVLIGFFHAAWACPCWVFLHWLDSVQRPISQGDRAYKFIIIIGLDWLKDVFEPFSKHYSVGAKWLLILDDHSSEQSFNCRLLQRECNCLPLHAFTYISFSSTTVTAILAFSMLTVAESSGLVIMWSHTPTDGYISRIILDPYSNPSWSFTLLLNGIVVILLIVTIVTTTRCWCFWAA